MEPPATTQSCAPPWPLIHFDVHCARCGHDLRGQAEPICPACKLEFSWEQAAPLEHLTCSKCNYHLYGIADARCPECGTAVDWNEALLRFRRREKPLFEYRWRDRPIRSFFGTWILALRPGRLWKTVDIHDPPQLKPLLAWTAIFLILTTISGPFWLGISMTIWGLQAFWAPNLFWSYSIDYLIQNWAILVSSPAVWLSSSFFALWWLFTLGSLLVFRQSMRLRRVRSLHVFRVCAYALPPLLLIYVLLSYVGTLFYRNVHPMELMGLAGTIINVWSFRQAYRHYIRMPHALGVAIASQVMAGLAVLISILLLPF